MKKNKRDRIKIPMTSDELMDFWNGVEDEDYKYEFRNETYKQIHKINTSDYSDGPSWDYIVQRQSDNKFFKFNVWDAGERHGFVLEDKFLIEVFEKTVITYE